MKNAICLSLFVAFVALVSPLSGHGQNREPVLVSLGILKSNVNCDLFPCYEFYSGTYTVPQGKRLVIEQIFFETRGDTNAGKPTARLRIGTYDPTTNIESKMNLPIQLINNSSSSENIFGTSQLMKLYVTSPANGKTVKVSVILDPQYYSHTFLSWGIFLSGYLEDVP